MTKQAKTKKNELLKRNVFTVLLAVSKCEAVSAQMPDFFFFFTNNFFNRMLTKKTKNIIFRIICYKHLF